MVFEKEENIKFRDASGKLLKKPIRTGNIDYDNIDYDKEHIKKIMGEYRQKQKQVRKQKIDRFLGKVDTFGKKAGKKYKGFQGWVDRNINPDIMGGDMGFDMKGFDTDFDFWGGSYGKKKKKKK